jgi:hypothetical protein
LEALSRRLEELPHSIAAVTAGAASRVVLWGLAHEFEQQFEPVPPVPHEILDSRGATHAKALTESEREHNRQVGSGRRE